MNEIDKFFEEFFGAAYRPARSNTGFPVTDLYTENDKLIFEFALAGYTRDSINIHTEDDKLIVGADEDHIEKPDRKYYQSRIAKRNFKVYYAIPSQYNLGSIDAKFEDGVLTIIIPKREESIKKLIDIK
jgi:HSP20 family protein